MAAPEHLETIRELALLNLHMIVTYAPMDQTAERAAINEVAARTNIDILRYLDYQNDDCPTCPYLDSLEDEEDEFCECGCGEDEEESVEDFISLLDPSFDPAFGTYLIFCKK